jgi:hypothetical protein
MAVMFTKDEQMFGTYLSKPGNFLVSWPPDPGPTREYLQVMQEIGVVREDINTRAMAFILDALTPSILDALSSHTKAPLDHTIKPDQPSLDELVKAGADFCDCSLTPKSAANLEGGKAMMRRKIEEAQAQLIGRSNS